jgi:hypothetical protein
MGHTQFTLLSAASLQTASGEESQPPLSFMQVRVGVQPSSPSPLPA